MTKASDNAFPSVLITEGTEPSAPAAGKQRLYIDSTTHLLKATNSSGTDRTIESTATVGPYAIVRYTTGDITLGSGTSPVVLSGPGDCVVAASSGDLLMVGLCVRNTDTDADSLSMDVATIVSASPVNYVSSLTGTPLTTGVPGWYFGVSRIEAVNGAVPYVVQSGDLSGGNITMRLYYRVSGVGKVLGASSTTPLIFWVKNLKQ